MLWVLNWIASLSQGNSNKYQQHNYDFIKKIRKKENIAKVSFNTIFNLITTHIQISAVKQFLSLQITASVLFVYFFIKAYVEGTHLNYTDLLMQFKWIPRTYAFIKTITKKKKKKKNTQKKTQKKTQKHCISIIIQMLRGYIFLSVPLSIDEYIFYYKFSQ